MATVCPRCVVVSHRAAAYIGSAGIAAIPIHFREFIMKIVLNAVLVAAGVAALVSTAGAAQIVTDHARLDGSIGKTSLQSSVVASVNRTVTEPRDPYSEGA